LLNHLPSSRSVERRLKRRQRSRRQLLAAAALLAGILVGWLLLGWQFFPRLDTANVRDLNANAKIQYVALVVESWSATHDTADAQARLRDLDHDELASILSDLLTTHQLQGETQQAAEVSAFASSLGFDLGKQVAVPAAISAPTNAPTTPTPTLVPLRVAVAPSVPRSIRAALEVWAQAQNTVLVPANARADLTVGAARQENSMLLAERVFVVVDWFPTLRTGITLADVRGLWQGQATHGGAKTLLVTDDAAEALTALWGQPAAAVQAMPYDQLVARLWNDSTTLGVVPFDQLTPKVTALPLDGQNVLSHEFKVEQYPLVARTYISGNSQLALNLLAGLRPQVPLTNRDPERITTLIMTGTTAITRTSAWKIEQKQDPALPARVIAPVLAAADITHVSNEVPFADNCAPVLTTMTFCSKPSYLATFKLAGVKIVGLTGNHLLDYGTAPFVKTLDIYDAAGLKYYGGGRDATEASKPLFLQDHGNRLAFLGANSFGPASDWATANRPGAYRYDAAALKQNIAAARAQADVVFVELQAEETYDYQPSRNNQLQFRTMLDDGADVVTGVQAHHPQTIEFGADGRHLILYGLGNLFFDQMFDLGVRQGIIARHTIYAGRLIQTELLTTMLEDYVQPRWTTPAERIALLTSVFDASGFRR
jgi:Bacterial capsule synthesis protein PGA_cap